MPYIAIDQDNKIVATSVTDDIALTENETLVEVPSIQLPDERRFCKYVDDPDNPIIVDEDYKSSVLAAEQAKEDGIKVAKKDISDKYKDMKKSDITDEDAMEYIKLNMAQDLGLEID